MENVKLLLCMKDVEYGRRLLRFLVQKKNLRLHPELVTVKSNVEFRRGSDREELVILTDYPDILEDGKRKVITLSDKQDREQKKIFQYQKAEEIYQELLFQLHLVPEEPWYGEPAAAVPEAGVYTIFSPEGRGRTWLAVSLSQYLARQGSCLYLQMTGFPVYYEGELKEEPEWQTEGMGELLFMLQQENFAEHARRLCRPFGSAEMLPPLAHFKDMLDCRPADWEIFLRRVKVECGYASVVVEVGQVYEFLLDTLEQSDEVLFLHSEGCIGKIQRAVFQRYCRMEKKESLLSRTRYISLSGDSDLWEEEWQRQSLTELAENRQAMMRIREILTGGERGDGENPKESGGEHNRNTPPRDGRNTRRHRNQ